eukprot:6357368-Pyramimonas_sp.AAC.1
MRSLFSSPATRRTQPARSCHVTPVSRRSTFRVQNVSVNTLRVGSARVGPRVGERIAPDLRVQSTS